MQQRRFLRLTEASTSRRADAVGGPLSWWRLLVRQLACLQAKVNTAGLGGQRIDPALPRGFVDRVGGFELADLPTELRGDLGAGLVTQAQNNPRSGDQLLVAV